MTIQIALAIAVILRLAGLTLYLIAALKGAGKPNIVSWTFWTVTPLLAAAAQLFAGSTSAAIWLTTSYAVEPMLIVSLCICRSGSTLRLTRQDATCAVCAVSGIGLWQATDSTYWAITFSILTGISAAVPTLTKTYHAPRNEPAGAYLLSGLSTASAIIAIDSWRFTDIAFALCVLTLDVTIVALGLLRRTATKPSREISSVGQNNLVPIHSPQVTNVVRTRCWCRHLHRGQRNRCGGSRNLPAIAPSSDRARSPAGKTR